MKIFNFFKKQITDKYIFEQLGRKTYIRNGVGFGFISDEFLYDNAYLEVGIGRVYSRYGDWGGGMDRISDSPIKITIDKNYIIQKIEKSLFDRKIEKKVDAIISRLKVGDKFIVKDEEFKNCLDKVLNFIPCKKHIGLDYFGYEHMLNHFTEEGLKLEYERLRDPINCKIEAI